MTEPNHLPKANHLRLSFGLLAILVIVISIIGFQKVTQWKAEEAERVERENYAKQRSQKLATEELVEQTRKNLRPQYNASAANPVVRERQLPASPVPVPETNELIEETPQGSRERSAVATPQVISGARGSGGRNGALSGYVRLTGTPPADKIITPLQNDPICGKLHTNAVTTRFYRVSSDGGLADVFVYIKDWRQQLVFNAPTDEPLLDQVDCLYEPYVMGVMVDQKFKIRNSDPVLHNVHATPLQNAEFNFAQPVQGTITEKVFNRPEVLVRFKCDVHPWMFAYVGVVAHPFYAVTDRTGSFEIPNLPPGRYTIEAKHLKAGTVSREIVIKKEQPTIVNLTLKVPTP